MQWTPSHLEPPHRGLRDIFVETPGLTQARGRGVMPASHALLEHNYTAPPAYASRRRFDPIGVSPLRSHGSLRPRDFAGDGRAADHVRALPRLAGAAAARQRAAQPA